MIVSMTGRGEVQRSENGIRYFLDMRSVNGRYFKSIIRLPEELHFVEEQVDRLLRQRLSRGSISVNLRVHDETAMAAYDINHAALGNYVSALGRAELPEGVHATIDLATLSTLPGVCQQPDTDDAERQRRAEVVCQMTGECLSQLLEMRRREGRALQDDLMRLADEVRAQMALISERAPVVLEEYHERLRVRVQTLVGKSTLELDEDALRREVAIYAERSDIAEEITRLRTHLDHFVELCEHGQGVGRRLEFLAQEMLRETNTIGSKSNDAGIARAVVETKALVDRIKEQVQNVE